MDAATTSVVKPQPRKRPETSIQALSGETLCIIFSFLDIVYLIRCSAVCKSWSAIIDNSKLLRMLYCKQQQQQSDSTSLVDVSAWSERSLKMQLVELAMERHRFSLQEVVFVTRLFTLLSLRVDKCCMKMGAVLTGGASKTMRLWSVESYKYLDEFSLPDKGPLVDFDFDESKVVGLVGSRICIWRRNGERNMISLREGEILKGSCMRYIDPEAVVGCEDGRARVFDMYSRKCSQIIKIHDGPVTCLSLTEDQLIIGGSSIGSITVTCPSSNQRVATLRPIVYEGCVSTLCFNPCSRMLFAGSSAGRASCWDLRSTRRSLWETRVSPNVIYSINHLRNNTSTLAIGGIDGVLRVVDQGTGQVFSSCVIDTSGSNVLNGNSKGPCGAVENKRGRRISDDTQLDRLPRGSRPAISCLAVGMQKIVTTHNDKYIRVWRFNR
ncbi:hypothetical protein LguiA_010729 [Lonicera macranthoides]